MSPEFLILCCLSAVLARRGGGSSFGRSTGSHYPASYGLSGTSRTNNYPNSRPYQQTHSYPHTPGLSGNTHGSNTRYTSKTEVHNHYHYNPPQQITYGSMQHPVYQGQPPVYVYEYRNSGSRFDNLLTGLALYNLGRMSSDHNHGHHEYRDRGYSGEMCKLVITKSNGEYEETRIDCKLMSSFIWEQPKPTTSVVTKTVSVQNTTITGNTTITTVQNTTIVDALHVKGPSITINPEMSCFLVHISRDYSQNKRKIECGLLQEYASRSLRYNGCSQVLPVLTFLGLFIFFFL